MQRGVHATHVRSLRMQFGCRLYAPKSPDGLQTRPFALTTNLPAYLTSVVCEMEELVFDERADGGICQRSSRIQGSSDRIRDCTEYNTPSPVLEREGGWGREGR